MNIKTMKLTLRKKYSSQPPDVIECIGFTIGYASDGMAMTIYSVDSVGYMDVVAMHHGVECFSVEKDAK